MTRRYGLVLSDLDRTATRSQGIVSYGFHLLMAIVPLLAGDEKLVAVVQPGTEASAISRSSRLELVEMASPGTGSFAKLVAHQVRLPNLLRELELDVIHFPKGLLPLALSVGRRPVAVTVHDDIPFEYLRGRFGSRRGGLRMAYAAFGLWTALRASETVITDSSFSAERISRFRPTSKLPAVVIPLAPALTCDSLAFKEPRILILGSDSPHKGVQGALNWLAQYSLERGSELAVEVVGGTRALVPTSLPHVRVTPGPLPESELARLISTASALVFNSEYEGFGLPPLEAFALGTPAVFARSPAVVESLGDVPTGYAIGDYEGFATALDRALAMTPTELQTLQALVLKRFTWQVTGEATLRAYRDLAHLRSGRA